MDYTNFKNKVLEETKDKIPVYKECPNKGELCFCTGICQEVVKWVDKPKV